MATDAEVLERQSKPGWLLPYLLALDIADIDNTGLNKKQRKEANIQDTCPDIFTGRGRWAYWLWILEQNQLPADPIPQIQFESHPNPQDAKAVQEWLRYPVRRHFSWYDEAWLMLVKWLLHGFGFTRMGVDREIERIPDDVKAQWYRQVNLANLLNSPCDWSAFVLQGGLADDKSKRSPWSHSTGFYSTPLDVCTMMAQMNFLTYDKLSETRVLTVCDPCVGTGSMLLPASNYSLRLYGVDIVGDLCLCSILNGYLWMPWLVVMPEQTQKMLEEHADQLNHLRTMRDFIISVPKTPKIGYDEPLRQQPEYLPARVVVDDNPQTVALAEERRQSAEAFYEAARNGELEQVRMF